MATRLDSSSNGTGAPEPGAGTTIAPKDRAFQRRIAPVVIDAPQRVAQGGSYEIHGIGFNGVTLGATYGDDVQAATNFPQVRIRNLQTSHVFYSRTHDHSSMAVASMK